MLRITPSVLLVPSAGARAALPGRDLALAGHAAFLEIAIAARGLEIAHLQFRFRSHTLAVCSRVRRSGLVEIEIGLGDSALPASVFTAQQLRDAENEIHRRTKAARRFH